MGGRMKKFVYIGGIPRTGTTGVAAFLHLNPQAFIYLATRGAHPGSNPCFYQQLIKRHQEGKYREHYTGAQMLVPTGAERDAEYWDFDRAKGVEEICEFKNNNMTGQEVDQLDLVGIREDYATRYFLRAKQCNFGRHAKLIFTTRLNLEQLFLSQYAMDKLHQGKVQDRADLFMYKLTQAYNQLNQAIRSHVADVLLVSVVDGEEHNWKRILDFVDMEPTKAQNDWMQNPPLTNTFGANVRRVVAQMEKHTVHKLAVSVCERYSSI